MLVKGATDLTKSQIREIYIWDRATALNFKNLPRHLLNFIAIASFKHTICGEISKDFSWDGLDLNDKMATKKAGHSMSPQRTGYNLKFRWSWKCSNISRDYDNHFGKWHLTKTASYDIICFTCVKQMISYDAFWGFHCINLVYICE